MFLGGLLALTHGVFLGLLALTYSAFVGPADPHPQDIFGNCWPSPTGAAGPHLWPVRAAGPHPCGVCGGWWPSLMTTMTTSASPGTSQAPGPAWGLICGLWGLLAFTCGLWGVLALTCGLWGCWPSLMPTISAGAGPVTSWALGPAGVAALVVPTDVTSQSVS